MRKCRYTPFAECTNPFLTCEACMGMHCASRAESPAVTPCVPAPDTSPTAEPYITISSYGNRPSIEIGVKGTF